MFIWCGFCLAVMFYVLCSQIWRKYVQDCLAVFIEYLCSFMKIGQIDVGDICLKSVGDNIEMLRHQLQVANIAMSPTSLSKTVPKPKYTRVEEPETEIPSTDNKENPLVTHIHSYSDDHISQRAPKMHSTPTHMIRKTCASTINRASTVFIELKGKNNAHII